jgi:protein-tyrosine phosphatase
MRRMAEDAGLSGVVEIDSAGTSLEHLGAPPDRRATAEADRRGLDLRSQRARRIQPDDWERFDLLLVADEPVERALLRQAPPGADLSKVHRMTAFGPDAGVVDEVPDPYYGGEDGFELVYEVVERACGGLLDHVRAVHGLA